MKTKNILSKFQLLVFLLGLSGCKDFVKIDPPVDQISTAVVYSNDETAIAAIRGIYSKMLSSSGFASGSRGSITLLSGKSADDFININAAENSKQFSSNNLLPENTSLRSGLWQEPYQVIYSANSLIENLEKSNQISSALKQQLIGEAKFIRAFCHFYLTGLFGNIPIILTTDYRKNTIAFQSSQKEVYLQVIEDLKDAKNKLSDVYPAGERCRANKWVATSLLARTYLYNKDWLNAEIQSSEVIKRKDMYNIILDDLDKVFLKNSQETILQFSVPLTLGVNTFEGNIFILNTVPSSTLDEVSLSSDLISAFEPGDLRLTKWVGSLKSGASIWNYSYKYKTKIGNTPMNEYSMVLRLAEQYLIRAESRIHLGDIENGIKDLNSLRQRARAVPTNDVSNPLPDLATNISFENALLAVEKERRIELFSEWGHRWLDLKRTDRANAVLGPFKGEDWQNTDVLYPIPAPELINAPNLRQNLGYEK